VSDVWRGHHKPTIGQHDRETMAGQVQKLLSVLSEKDVMWLAYLITSANKTNE